MAEYKAGIIGLGFIGAADQVSGDALGQQVADLDGTHLMALDNHPQVEVVAGSSRDEGRRQRFAARTGARQSPPSTVTRSCSFRVSTLSRHRLRAAWFCSIRVTWVAPRDTVSRPSAPVPAKPSSTRAPGTRAATTLNNVSRNLSDVGRSPAHVGVTSRRPLNTRSTEFLIRPRKTH